MSLGLLLAALAAGAPQVAAPAAPPQPAAEPAKGVISYPADFFAPSQPNTARDMIDRLPGFSFDDGEDVRGFGGAAGNVLIDGERPASKSDDLDSILRRVPAGQVERIDLIRGGAPGIDMQGKTVVANVVRKKAASVTGLISVVHAVAYDGRETPGLRLEATSHKGLTTLEGSLVISGFVDDGDGDGPRRVRSFTGDPTLFSQVDTEGDGTQVVATGAYATPLAGGKFRINGQYFHQKYEEDIDDHYLSQAGGTVERDSNTKDTLEVGLHWSRDLTPKASLETIFLESATKYHLYDKFQAQDETDYFTDNHSNGETVGRAVLRYRASPNLSFEAGGEAAFNWLHSRTNYAVNGDPVDLPAAHVQVTEKRGEAFVLATWKVTPTLTIEGAFTEEASTIASSGDVTLEKTLYFPKPRLSLTWSPDPKNQVRLKIEHEVGQLDFGDFVASSSLSGNGSIHVGNPDLNPQQDWLAEAAIEHRFWGSASVTLTLRHFQITDQIDRAPVFSPPSECNPVPDPNACIFDAPANIGSGSRDVLVVDFNLPLDRLFIKGGQLRFEGFKRRSEVTDPTTHQKREASGLHPDDWEAHFTQDLPRWKMNWGVDVFGAWREPYYRYNEIETYRLKTYVTPFLEYKPRRDIAVRFEIQNATKRGFERTIEDFGGPRSVSLPASDDVRFLRFGRIFYVRVRKTFG